MATIHLKGPGLNDYFARELVRDLGAEGARKATCGAAREAVERVIGQKHAEGKPSNSSANSSKA